MLRLAFDFIITWRETRTRPNAYMRSAWIITGKPTWKVVVYLAWIITRKST